MASPMDTYNLKDKVAFVTGASLQYVTFCLELSVRASAVRVALSVALAVPCAISSILEIVDC